MERYLISPEDYLLMKQAKFGISTSTNWTKENIEKYGVDQLWWNSVSGTVPVQCKTCISDNIRFKQLIREKGILSVSEFDKKNVDKRESKKNNNLQVNKNKNEPERRECCWQCFWFDYFYSRRLEILKNYKKPSALSENFNKMKI